MADAVTLGAWSFAAVAGALALLWVVSVLVRDASIVDIAWGPAFAVIGWTAFLVGHGETASRVLVVGMASLWAVRLAAYLAWRNLGHGEDVRYQKMRAFWGTRFWWVSLFTVFLLQAALAWVVSLPVQGVQYGGAGGLNAAHVLGGAIWGIGMFFETVGDLQLALFKRDPANRGVVMDRGLWRYTRHPNYFGNALIWWGIYVAAVASNPGLWWSAIGPLVMTVLLLRVSGVALLERQLVRTKPGYEAYVARTSAFVPMPPRRA